MGKILVVDDERQILDMLEEFLTRHSYQVITTDNGQEALEIIDEEMIDLLIIDKKMPGLSGRDVVQEIKGRGRDIPVIVISGSLGEASWTIEASGFVHKPLDLEEVLRKINDILSDY